MCVFKRFFDTLWWYEYHQASEVLGTFYSNGIYGKYYSKYILHLRYYNPTVLCFKVGFWVVFSSYSGYNFTNFDLVLT